MQTLDWGFVLLFLAIRAFAALIALIYTLISKGDVGDFAVHYLAPTWIDVITFGVPVLTAMFGPKVGQHYPVLAAFSSFIFELPVILLAFQIFISRRELKAKREENDAGRAPAATTTTTTEQSSINEPLVESITDVSTSSSPGPQTEDEEEGKDAPKQQGSAKKGDKARLPWGRIFKNVALRMLKTPPFIAIILGIIWGSIGWQLPTVLATILTNLGNCVTPVATFCVGIFITDGKPFKRAWRKTIIYMLMKIVGMPLLAMALIAAFGFKPPVSEVGLVIASLPLAFPAFTFAKEYGRGEDVMSTCIATGTILMLPVVIFWAYCADWVFGDHSPASPSASASASASSDDWSSLSNATTF